MCLHTRKPHKMPVHVFRYLKAQVSKQGIKCFPGALLPTLRGSWALLPQAGRRHSPNASHGKAAAPVPVGATVQHVGGKVQPTPITPFVCWKCLCCPASWSCRHGRVLAHWHSKIPSVQSTSWAWVAAHLMLGKGISASNSHVKITCLLWDLSQLTCAV